ncbi:MAG: hypothetical protein BVN29_04835 [Nitrospira sp. ST-bin5]|nr:MAG: hypothetical protein BVN29_04835 [Nitrospira sp. ST-bin5]
MKIFLVVIVVATLIGGFVVGELMDKTFSLLGAVVGGVGLTAVLLGLGAFFTAQEEKKKKETLPPEIRGAFDRLMGKSLNSPSSRPVVSKLGSSKKSAASPKDDLLSIEGTIKSLMEQDAESIDRGEIPERRLIPHHAIKRDVIITAYSKDFQLAVSQIRAMSWTEVEKQHRLSEIEADFDKQIYGIKRLSWEDLDKIIALMKKTRTDLAEIESGIRSKTPMYKIVDPL